MQTVIQNLIQTLTKAGRTTIDFTNEDDVAFFTPLMNDALTKNDKKTKKTKAVKEDKVKKDLNSYMVYCEWARKNTEFPDMKPKDISRRLGEMWRSLSDEEKAVYKKQADANKRPVEARADSPKRAESPKNADADAVKPKKPLTSYIKFSNAMRDSVKTAVMNPQDVSRHLGEMWRALSDEEKAKWKGEDVSVAAVVKKDEPVVVADPVVEEKKEPVEDKRDESPKKSKKTKKVKEDVKEDAPVEQAADDTESKTEKKTEKKMEKKSKKASE
jgi:hypothetical protein